MRLDDIMTAPVATVPATATVAEARAEMDRGRVRHLVVVKSPHKKVVGVVCDHDLRDARPETTVGEVMSAPAVTLPPSADVQEAAKLLRVRNVGSVAVVKERRLAGIVTTSDLLALIGKGTLHVQPRPAKWVLAKRGPTHRRQPRGT